MTGMDSQSPVNVVSIKQIGAISKAFFCVHVRFRVVALVTRLAVVDDQSLRSYEFSHLHPDAIPKIVIGRGRSFYDVWYLHYNVNPKFLRDPLASR